MRHTNFVENIEGVWREYSVRLDASGNDTGEWTKTYLDMVGRSFLAIQSGLATNRSFYNVKAS
jgi:hypothetical protein